MKGDIKSRTDMSYGTGAKYGGSAKKDGKKPVQYQGAKTMISEAKKQ